MKLLDINGKLVNVDVRPSKYPIKECSRSNLQGQTGQYLIELFPMDVILEDFILPGSRLSVDFFIPKRKTAIEVQGRQHLERVDHFHGPVTNFGYKKQLNRDQNKLEWCLLNKISLIEIFELKDLKTLKDKI